MEKNENVQFMTELTDEQLDFLSEGKKARNRMKVFSYLMKNTEPQPYTIKKRRVSVDLPAGTVSASVKDICVSLNLSKKVVSNILKDLNNAGLVKTDSNHVTSVHTVLALKGWMASEFVKLNPATAETVIVL